MGAFRIIFTLTTMSCLTYCYELTFVLDLPQVVDSIADMASQAMPSARSAQQLRANDNPDEEDLTIPEKIKKFTLDVYGYVTSWFNRRANYETMKPMVEMGPGVIKSEIMSYPENYFVRKLKLLLKSKEKEQEKNKPLN